jgi:DNA-binding NarL/FixJ family response regulator
MTSSVTDQKILIADGDPIFRKRLTKILSLKNDMKVVGEASDAEEACELYDEVSPDILDFWMPKKDGLEVVAELMSWTRRPRVLVLTTSEKIEDLADKLVVSNPSQ